MIRGLGVAKINNKYLLFFREKGDKAQVKIAHSSDGFDFVPSALGVTVFTAEGKTVVLNNIANIRAVEQGGGFF